MVEREIRMRESEMASQSDCGVQGCGEPAVSEVEITIGGPVHWALVCQRHHDEAWEVGMGVRKLQREGCS